MTNREAMEIVLGMANELRETCKVQREDVEMEAIYQVQDYMNDLMREERLIIRGKPATGCDYGIGG